MLINKVSDTNGPETLIPDFFNFLIAGIIIFTSSEFLLSSALWGFRPKIPILGLKLKISLYHFSIILAIITIFYAEIFLEICFTLICVVIGAIANFLFFINITSLLFFILHLVAKYSVTPNPFFFNSFLSIAQLIIPLTSFLKAN